MNGIKLRTNTFETKVTKNRGRLADKTCRRCHQTDESLMHVLQWSDATKPTRHARHHRICHRVTQKIREQGHQVLREKNFPDPNKPGHYLPPDIIAIKDQKAQVLDVSVVYEIKNELNCTDVTIGGLIIGARGSYYHRQLQSWHGLGFNSTELRYLTIGCMEDSIRILSTSNLSSN